MGRKKVSSSATYVQIVLQAPGVIEQNGDFYLVIGELAASSLNTAKKIEMLLNRSGINTKHSSRIMDYKWRKYIWNATFNPLLAAMEVNVGKILDNQHLRLIAEKICLEVISVVQK